MSEEVTAKLGLTYDTVLRLLRAGDLPGYKADRKPWRIGFLFFVEGRTWLALRFRQAPRGSRTDYWASGPPI